ncbi:MAG: hypothetical protein RLP44_05660 [Aggregatilineales bacterium]
MSQALLNNQQKSALRQETRLNIPFYLWLTVPVAISTLIVALSGVINPADVYKNSESLAAQGQAQDLVTLIVALPALLLSTWYVAHESIRGRIVWLGTMTYLAYTYAISAFQVEFNQLFLFYVLILGGAFYGTLLGFLNIKLDDVRLSEKTPVRVVSLIAGFIAFAYYGLWLSDLIPAVLNNTVPEAVITDKIPTSAVHVLDMGFYLPLLLVGAVLLWQRKPMGLVITGATLSFGVIMGLAVGAMVVNQARWEVIDSLAPVIIFAVTTILIGGALIGLLRNVEA